MTHVEETTDSLAHQLKNPVEEGLAQAGVALVKTPTEDAGALKNDINKMLAKNSHKGGFRPSCRSPGVFG